MNLNSMNKFQYTLLIFSSLLSFNTFSLDALTAKMIADYEQNQARFAKNHRGTILSGTGAVKSVKAGLIGRDRYSVKLDVSGSALQCWTENYEKISEFNSGQHVRFTGRVDDVIFDELILDKCEFEAIQVKESAIEKPEKVPNQPSFDCNNSTNEYEISVCADNLLSQTDVNNARQYKRALAIDKIRAKEITDKSYKQRVNCKDNRECLYKSYEESTIAYIKIIKTSAKNDFYQTNKGAPAIIVKK